MKTLNRNSHATGSLVLNYLGVAEIVSGLLLLTMLLWPIVSEAYVPVSGPQKLVIDEAHDRYLITNFYTTVITQVDADEAETMFIEGAGCVDRMVIGGNTV